MTKRIIWNDLKSNKLLSFSTWIFMTVSALLFGLTCFLFMDLLGSIDVLMEKAQTPDFLQMHTGEIHAQKLADFAEKNEQVKKYQVLHFLNLENGIITLNGHSLADSGQDNGVSVQSSKFDYLVNTENQVIKVQKGELYVPVCYQQEYDLKVGQLAQIGKEVFRIAGFLRDSQMNSMMASSKRFLVNEADYQTLYATGSEEYLIEFLLNEKADVNVFAAQYTDADLPSNGPAITRPLIRMMNALSDGMMVLVILLISVVMLLISILCIRFTLLTRLEEDQREIGMLKAVGISKKSIRQIYFLKYLVLSVAGALTGLLMTYLCKRPLQAGMQKLYGTTENGMFSFLISTLGVMLTEAILLFSIFRTLKRTERLTAVEALTGRQDQLKKPLFSPQYTIVVFVIAASVFLMTVPQNLHHTISSPEVVTYMGIGNGEILVDIRQTDNIVEETKQVEEKIAIDDQVKQYASFLTKSYRVILSDGSYANLNVQLGNHTAFPVTYASGKAPVSEKEIALSYLCANEYNVKPGDTITLIVNDIEQSFTVCGIYSDITNGGKTAKATYIKDSSPAMWSVFYVSLKNNTWKEQWISTYETALASQKINANIVDVQDKMNAIYGRTMEQIQKAAQVAMFATLIIMIVVVLLFTRLLVAKDRNDISLQKAIGLTNIQIKQHYGMKYLILTFVGIFLGVILGNLLGECIVGMLLRSLGAIGFHFLVNRVVVYIAIPVLAFASVFVAVILGLRETKGIKAYECCAGKE